MRGPSVLMWIQILKWVFKMMMRAAMLSPNRSNPALPDGCWKQSELPKGLKAEQQRSTVELGAAGRGSGPSMHTERNSSLPKYNTQVSSVLLCWHLADCRGPKNAWCSIYVIEKALKPDLLHDRTAWVSKAVILMSSGFPFQMERSERSLKCQENAIGKPSPATTLGN